MVQVSDPLGYAAEAMGPELWPTMLRLAETPPSDAAPRPLFNEDSLAAAVVTRGGRIIVASRGFGIGAAALEQDLDLLRGLPAAEPVRFVRPDADDDEGTTATVRAYARASNVTDWILPADVRAAALAHPGAFVVLTCLSPATHGPLEAACRAFGLSGLQTRVAVEAVRTGSVRVAAQRAGVTYDTAREAIAEAMGRVRAPRLTALVHRLVSLAFGVLPQADGVDTLGDAWGLSARQAAIAALISDGLTRPNTAKALGLSEALVQRELKDIHRLLGVASAAGLARKVAEATALGWMIRSTGGDVGLIEAGAEPLRIVYRPDGGRIAVSDYGPASGRPILVVHSSMTSRVVARSLRRTLQASGFRPIAIDRPGFGLTDEVDGMRPGAHDPYATAAADAVRVLDALRIGRIDVVARGGAQAAVALHLAAPDRLGRVVLVNPDPPSVASGERPGPLNAVKDAFQRNPALIRIWAGIIGRQLTYERVSRLLTRWMRGSPPDEAAARDPEIIDDYFRAVRTFATGRFAGYVNEQVDFALRTTDATPVPGAEDWRVIVGGYDTLHDPDRVLAYWRAVLPDAHVWRVLDAGRLLAMSHPQDVVRALSDGRP